MKLSDMYEKLNAVAPKSLSDEFCAQCNGYDNSGILVDTGDDLIAAVFSLDLTNAAIDKAIELGANLIVTHHPAIYGKISNLLIDDDHLLGGKLVRCLKNGISVVSMHLNLDMVQGGIDDSLMQGVRLSAGEGAKDGAETMIKVQGGGYGKVYEVAQTTLGNLVDNMQRVFNSKCILYYGDKNKRIGRAASFCGAGGDEQGVAFAKKCNADVIISSDFKHHVITYAIESGLSVIVMTHYASEQYGFRKYYEKIREQAAIPCIYHTDDILL